jgi:hypothetical protein
MQIVNKNKPRVAKREKKKQHKKQDKRTKYSNKKHYA